MKCLNLPDLVIEIKDINNTTLIITKNYHYSGNKELVNLRLGDEVNLITKNGINYPNGAYLGTGTVIKKNNLLGSVKLKFSSAN
jgi:hypothetical protein